ncbi:MAG: glycosyltransferase family 2 protein [Bacteroidota bacterium]|nr:glycosyltransferase family 2 protein [Bacteroidota bacterium]
MKTCSQPKVSVIIPAFNEENYIQQTLEALLLQDYRNFEIIITDNASTDRTAFIINQFIESNHKRGVPISLLHEAKRGTNFARECSRNAATGSIIAQLDADCIPAANWISKGVSHLCNHQKDVAITGPYDYFDGNKGLRIFSLITQKIFYPLVSQTVQLFNRGAILIGGNAFIRSEALAQIGGYNTTLTFYGDDVDLGKRLTRIGYVTYNPSLILLSSYRRYKAEGFWKVNKKYQVSFWNIVWQRNHLLPKMETSHPR